MEVLCPELFAELRVAPAELQRAASLAAAEYALARTKTNKPVVDEVINDLRNGKSIPPGKRQALENIAGEFDNQYFDLKEAEEEDDTNDQAWLSSFLNARAVAALSFATLPDPFEAASEAVYEAAATIESDDKRELFAVIRNVIRR